MTDEYTSTTEIRDNLRAYLTQDGALDLGHVPIHIITLSKIGQMPRELFLEKVEMLWDAISVEEMRDN